MWRALYVILVKTFVKTICHKTMLYALSFLLPGRAKWEINAALSLQCQMGRKRDVKLWEKLQKREKEKKRTDTF